MVRRPTTWLRSPMAFGRPRIALVVACLVSTLPVLLAGWPVPPRLRARGGYGRRRPECGSAGCGGGNSRARSWSDCLAGVHAWSRGGRSIVASSHLSAPRGRMSPHWRCGNGGPGEAGVDRRVPLPGATNCFTEPSFSLLRWRLSSPASCWTGAARIYTLSGATRPPHEDRDRFLGTWVVPSLFQILEGGSLTRGADGFRLTQAYVGRRSRCSLPLRSLPTPDGFVQLPAGSALESSPHTPPSALFTGPSAPERSVPAEPTGVTEYGNAFRAVRLVLRRSRARQLCVPAGVFAYGLALLSPGNRVLGAAAVFAAGGCCPPSARTAAPGIVHTRRGRDPRLCDRRPDGVRDPTRPPPRRPRERRRPSSRCRRNHRRKPGVPCPQVSNERDRPPAEGRVDADALRYVARVRSRDSPTSTRDRARNRGQRQRGRRPHRRDRR